jgi:NAD(P)-dependent dehydrogenase (short-subunit alcohol dehydrogenase family)
VSSNDDLSGRSALVTGAAHGIGLAIARRVLAAGADVVALDRDEEALAAAFREGEATQFVAEVGADDPVALGDRLLAEHGPLQLIVNNVGISTPHRFLELEPSDWDRVFATNVRGPWFLTRQLVRALVDAGEPGSVLFISSIHDAHVRLHPHYSASKAAVAMLVRELAHELGPHGIRVNAVSPGWISTEDHVDPAHAAALTSRIPAGRPGDADDVAEIAVALLGDGARYVTGARIPVDGGLSLHTWLSDL